MYKVQVFKGKDAKEAAATALRWKLYVSGWNLSGVLKRIRDEAQDGEIALGYLYGIPVCVVMVSGRNIQAFCRKALRGKGYASKAIKALKPVNVSADRGIDGSQDFWRANGINCW